MNNLEIESNKPDSVTSTPETDTNLPLGILLKTLKWLRETAADNLFNQPWEN